MYKDDMNVTGAGKSRENFSSVLPALFLQMQPLKGDELVQDGQARMRQVLVEITHPSITQLLFTQFSSKNFNVHHESDNSFLSLLTWRQ